MLLVQTLGGNLFNVEDSGFQSTFVVRFKHYLNCIETGSPQVFKVKPGVFPQRYVFGILGFLAVANSYMMRTCLNLAIVEMVLAPRNSSVKESADHCPGELPESGHQHVEGFRFNWNEKEQGFILSAFYGGYILTHLPGGYLAEHYGGKQVVGLGLLFCGICTLFSPLCARMGWMMLAFLRFLEGICEGVMYPALNVLVAHWAPLAERGRIGALVFAGNQIGIVISNCITGFLLKISEGNWPLVFYLFGITCIIWYILWFIFVYSTPLVHPFISDEEKDYIYARITEEGITKKAKLPPEPWLKILTSIPIWALVIAEIGHDWSLYLAQSELSKYMKSVLKFSIAQNGVLSSLPFLLMWFIAVSSGLATDFLFKYDILSIGVQRKLFTAVAALGPGFGCVAAAYAGCNRTVVMILFSLGMAQMGFYYSSLKVNALDLSPNYSGVTMAIVNGLGSFAGMFVPIVTGMLITDNTLSQWRIVFWVSAGIIMGTTLFFVLFGSAKVQPWNEPDE